MKKLILSLMALLVSTIISAQETNKNKDSNSTNGAQERSINESGVSVKTKSQTKSNVNTVVTPSVPASDAKKSKEQKKDIKKPE